MIVHRSDIATDVTSGKEEKQRNACFFLFGAYLHVQTECSLLFHYVYNYTLSGDNLLWPIMYRAWYYTK